MSDPERLRPGETRQTLTERGQMRSIASSKADGGDCLSRLVEKAMGKPVVEIAAVAD